MLIIVNPCVLHSGCNVGSGTLFHYTFKCNLMLELRVCSVALLFDKLWTMKLQCRPDTNHSILYSCSLIY